MSLKQAVLDELIQAGDCPLSGQGLADKLQVSRNAIWKTIEQLRDSGYQIASIGRKGYQLQQLVHTLDANQIIQATQDSWPQLRVYYEQQVTSTNDLAKAFIIEHPGQAALFIASQQTKGRGRQGRYFHSDIQEGIYFSLVFSTMHEDPALIPTYTILAATAMTEAIESLTAIPIQIKWVNDLFAHGRKIAGILSEATADLETQSIGSITIGIGINLLGDFAQADASTQQTAGCLYTEALPADFNKNQLLISFLERFNYHRNHFAQREFIQIYRQHLLGLNQRVSFSHHQEQREGIIRGIDSDGHLLIENSAGQIETLFSQEVHFSSQQFTQA